MANRGGRNFECLLNRPIKAQCCLDHQVLYICCESVALNAAEATLLRCAAQRATVKGVYCSFMDRETQAATLNARVYDQVASFQAAKPKEGSDN